jgi:hypothetical protein
MRVEMLDGESYTYKYEGTIRLINSKVILDFENPRIENFFSKVYYGDKYYFPDDGEDYMRALKAFNNSTTIAIVFETDEERQFYQND